MRIGELLLVIRLGTVPVLLEGRRSLEYTPTGVMASFTWFPAKTMLVRVVGSCQVTK